MTSPSARPGTSRRRQRSTRVLVAGTLVVSAALFAIGAAASGSWAVAAISAVVIACLGAAATRIVYIELADSRRFAARDRADLAKVYAEITEQRVEENALFIAQTTGQLAQREAVIRRLESRLADAAAELAEARRDLDEQTTRADAAIRDAQRLAGQLGEAEARAADAVVRIAELEQELELVLAEWQAGEGKRKRA